MEETNDKWEQLHDSGLDNPLVIEETKRKVVLAIGKDVVGVEIVNLKELAKEQNVDLEIIEDDGEGIRRLNVPEPTLIPYKKLMNHLHYYDLIYSIPEVDHTHGPHPKKIRGYVASIRTTPKYQRNEPCPCGSGKKFKRCCINS